MRISKFGQKSYRSIDESFDVNEVAVKHGGGGHPGPCACSPIGPEFFHSQVSSSLVSSTNSLIAVVLLLILKNWNQFLENL